MSIGTVTTGHYQPALKMAEDNPKDFSQMSDKRAVDILSAYSGKLDTAAGIGGQDGKIGKVDLEAIANDKNQPTELRQAASKALHDDAFRNQIQQGGEKGNFITPGELEKAQTSMAGQTLGNDGREAVGGGAGNAGGAGRTSDTSAADIFKQLAEAFSGGDKGNVANSPMDLISQLLEKLSGASDTSNKGKTDKAPMSDERVLDVLSAYSGKLDTAAGIGGKDGVIAKVDLKAIASDKSQPPELRQAVKQLLNDDALMNQINQGGDNGKMISLDELKTAQKSTAGQSLGRDDGEKLGGSGGAEKAPELSGRELYNQILDRIMNGGETEKTNRKEPMSDERVLDVLSAYSGKLDTAAGIGGKDGVIAKVDLKAIASDKSQPPELRQAVKQLLNDDALMNQINQGGDNGKMISLDELKTAQKSTAGQSLGRDDGEKVGGNPLEQMMNKIVEFLRSETKPESGVDKAGPGSILEKLLETMIGGEDKGKTGKKEPMSDARASEVLSAYADKLDTAAGIGGKDGKIGKVDLQAIARDKSQPPELREAVGKLLKDDAFMNQVQQGGEKGSFITKNELKDAMNNMSGQTLGNDGTEAVGKSRSEGVVDHSNMSDKRAATLLSEHSHELDVIGGGEANGRISNDSLKLMAKDESQPMELRQAAQKLLDDEGFQAKVQSGGEEGSFYSPGELAKAAGGGATGNMGKTDKAPMSDERVLEVISAYSGKLDTAAGIGGKDGVIAKVDLKAIANDKGQPPELRQAVKQLLNDDALMNQINQGGDNGKMISMDELKAALKSTEGQSLGRDGGERVGLPPAQ